MIERMKRVEEAVKREISSILQQNIYDPLINTNILITRVKVTKDLRLAKVFWVIEDDTVENANKEKIERSLKRSASYFRKQIAERLSMKYIPRVSFMEDISLEESEKVDKLFTIIESEHQDPDSESEILDGDIDDRKDEE